MYKVIESKDNKLIINLGKLFDKKERIERQEFLVEGLHLVDEAYNDNRLLMVLSTKKEELDKYDCEKYLVNDVVMNKLTKTVNSQNIIGLVKIKEAKLNKQKKIVLLDDVRDPGNLGTIIRSACALGYELIISSENCVDYYNDKTIRATQGAIFKIDLMKANLNDIIKELKESGYHIYGTSLKNSISLKDINKQDKFGVVFGNEAHGVSKNTLALCDELIRIDMKNNVESLNVATSSAIVLYELNK